MKVPGINAWPADTASAVAFTAGYLIGRRDVSESQGTDWQAEEHSTTLTGVNTLVEMADHEAAASGMASQPINVELFVELAAHRQRPQETLDGDTNRKFQEHLRKWKAETRFESSMTEIILHPDYQRIIGMGSSVVPLLLAELRSEPNWLFWALQSITGEDPVPESSRGNLDGMAEAWLEWGRKNGFIDSPRTMVFLPRTCVDTIRLQ